MVSDFGSLLYVAFSFQFDQLRPPLYLWSAVPSGGVIYSKRSENTYRWVLYQIRLWLPSVGMFHVRVVEWATLLTFLFGV